MEGQQRRVGCNVALVTNCISKHLEIAVYFILRLQRQLICILRVVDEAPRGDILLVAVGWIFRTFDECRIGCSLFV